MISIRKICVKCICRLLELIFNECNEWRFPIRMEKGKRGAYSQEKQSTMFRKLPPCLVTASLWQNPRTFHT